MKYWLVAQPGFRERWLLDGVTCEAQRSAALLTHSHKDTI
jgi:hypothetical protein